MSEPKRYTTRHTIEIDAPPDAVYTLVERAEEWPRLFPPTLHAERIEGDDTSERLRIWATANGEVKSWTSRRGLDRDGLRIDFHQEVSQPPVASMGGTWSLAPLPDQRTLVTLDHDFTAVGDEPDKVSWIEQAIDRNSQAELGALKSAAELARLDELLLTFDDTVTVAGSAKDVYDFLNEADKWRDRLPHVKEVALTEEQPGVQTLEMDTLTKDGSTHTTRSVRICFPTRVIHYKQLQVPALMTVHTGRWLLDEIPEGVRLTSTHTVVIKPEAVTEILGQAATVADAREFVHRALSANSTTTMHLAKAFAEERAAS